MAGTILQEDFPDRQIVPARYAKVIEPADLANDFRVERRAQAIRNNTAANLNLSYENADGTRETITLLPLELIPFVPHTIRATGSGVNDGSFSLVIFYSDLPKRRT